MVSTSGVMGTFFAPAGVAVVGASPDLGRNGGRTFAHLCRFGYTGGIHPVNPRHDQINGFPCYPSLRQVPDPVDLAVLCVAAHRIPGVLDECAQRGIGAAVVFSAAFATHGSGQSTTDGLGRAARAAGVRLIGPATSGYRVVTTGVFATSATDLDGADGGVTPGRVAMIAQSGGLGIYLGSAHARRRGVGAKYVIDTGGEVDVDAVDCLEYVAADPDVDCVALVLEGTRDGRRLTRAVRAAVRGGTAVVFLRTGRSAAAADQVASHTGALAAGPALFDRAMRGAGAQVVADETELVDALVLHSARRVPAGRRLGVVTPSGGYAVLTLDAAERFGLQVPPPDRRPTAAQRAGLTSARLANPLDYAARGSAGPTTLRCALDWMLGQPNLDAVLLWQAYLMLDEARRHALLGVLDDLLDRHHTPLYGCGITTEEFQRELASRGVPWFDEPTRLVRALGVVAPPAGTAGPRTTRPTGGGPPGSARPAAVIGGSAARQVLSGLDHVATVPVDGVAEARAVQDRWRAPIMLKADSVTLAHKSDAGLVEGPLDADRVADAFQRLCRARAASADPAAPIVAQPFQAGAELALGAYLDPTFGPSVMVAAGGLFVELLDDTAFAPAPLSVERAGELIGELRYAAVLRGARGRAPADLPAAARALAWLSRFIAEHADEYTSVDVNPLIVRGAQRGAVAVDALLVPREKVRTDA